MMGRSLDPSKFCSQPDGKTKVPSVRKGTRSKPCLVFVVLELPFPSALELIERLVGESAVSRLLFLGRLMIGGTRKSGANYSLFSRALWGLFSPLLRLRIFGQSKQGLLDGFHSLMGQLSAFLFLGMPHLVPSV